LAIRAKTAIPLDGWGLMNVTYFEETEGDIVNCESGPGKLGGLSMSFYSSLFMRAIHYVPLGPLTQQPSMD
jgi:hypothetical protein